MWSFYKTLLKNPKAVGAAMPSSVFLARAIASFVDPQNSGLVLELGAGTGVITRALLKQGLDTKQLLVVDSSMTMIKKLNKSFPTLNVVHGDAADLKQLLLHYPMPLSTIVSSLPLLSMPANKRQQIMESMLDVLLPGGSLIQFTYGLWKPSIFEQHTQLKKRVSKFVFCNLPPARVDVFDVIKS